jgi:hypothetical protein
MSYIDEILREMTEELVSAKPPFWAKIHGIAKTQHQGRDVLEVYYDKETPFEFIRQELSFYRRNIEIFGIPTEGFVPYKGNLQSGSAIAHAQSKGYGTLGGFVLDAHSKKVLILSNSHIIANNNQARIGDAVVAHPSKQPIGRLYRFEPLLPPPHVNTIDAALSSVFKKDFTGSYLSHRHKVAQPQVGMSVYKTGARTGLRHGTVTSVNAVVSVDYDGLGTLNFANTIVVEGSNGLPFSKLGDSGSFIVNEDGCVVGLVFAGDPQGNLSFGNSIAEVAKRLEIRF